MFYSTVSNPSDLADVEYPCATISWEKWDDYGHKITYELIIWTSPTKSQEIGQVKLLHRLEDGEIETKTTLPAKFEALTPSYCSLGQEKKYYQVLGDHADGKRILEALRDVVLEPGFAVAFEGEKAFNDSLLRFSEAINNYQKASVLLGREPTSVSVPNTQSLQRSFVFTHTVVGFTTPHKVELNFHEHNSLPHRIIAFVGKNGTGKTAILVELANQISGVLGGQLEGFEPARPTFSRIVVISYSPFGPFRYPPYTTSSYRYCGLLNKQNLMDSVVFESRIKNQLREIHSTGRRPRWLEALSIAGLTSSEPLTEGMAAVAEPEENFALFKKMSSGNFYAACVVTDLVSNLIEESLVIFDEPELYLHPNVTSGLMRAIDFLIKQSECNSYCVMATHSPIVIQEIPSRFVRCFLRLGSEPHCLNVDFETFGENLTAIVNRVFGAGREDKNYMSILEDLCKGKTEEDVDELFDGRLSMSAMGFVSSVISEGIAGRDKR